MDEIADIKRRAGIIEGAGPSRIVTHIIQRDAFIAISPERDYRSKTENRQAMDQMKADLARTPTGYIRQQGEWAGIPEQSLLIFPRKKLAPDEIDAFKEIGIRLMKKYDQMAIVFGDGNKIVMINQDGSVDDWGLDSVSFNRDKMQDAGGNSIIRKTPYVFSAPDATDPDTIGASTPRAPRVRA